VRLAFPSQAILPPSRKTHGQPHVSWEFICNIGFEYGLLRGRRLWRWTAAVSGPSFSFFLHQSYNITIPAVTNGLLSSFFPTDLHCLSALHHLPGGHRSRGHEFAPRIRLQGALSCSLPKSPSCLPLLSLALVDLFCSMCSSP